MADIKTLIPDILELLDNPREAHKENVAEFAEVLAKVISNRLSEEKGATYLRLSNWDAPCKRQTWYKINFPEKVEKLPPQAKLKFLIGDICEAVLFFLAAEAGHEVKGQQDNVEVAGVKGHRDGIIDGRVVDAKSAAPFSFEKFRSNGLREKDSFGYLGQLGSYLAASQEDVRPTERDRASFFVFQKVSGEILLDTYEFPESREELEGRIGSVKEIIERDQPPPRAFDPEPHGKSGNMKLGVECSYCPVKHLCHPKLRGFAYSNGPVYLTQVVEVPKVPEFEIG